MSGVDNYVDGRGGGHMDEETIALLALGEVGAGEQNDHLRSCAACQAKVDQLRAVVDSARFVTEEDHPMSPPDTVWDQIVADIDPDGGSHDSGRVPRGARMGWFALAAAVGLVVGSVGTLVALDQQNPAPTIAQAVLEPLPGQSVRGVAQVRDTSDGPILMVDVADLPETTGYYEVWMFTPDADSMVSVGALGNGSVNQFPLPPGMDMTAFPVVDISLEQFDGDVTHSSDSIVRGALDV